MRMYDVIKKKRDGEKLNKAEIDLFVQGYVNGDIPDYQVSALLMAIFFKGMSYEETLMLTKAMVDSGDSFDLDEVVGIKVDKHSTGGVGDTVTLILAPILAALGLNVAKMSGRGLGYTGGTLDKLESIPGFNSELDYCDFIEKINRNHLCICSQTGNITPADKKIYALRDVTATVDIIPLIASSIMSKKLAIKSDHLILDVKVGSGAFMKDIETATLLGEEMVKIGRGNGRDVAVVLSNMDEPLGTSVGNILEVKEAIEFLHGRYSQDIKELVYHLCSKLLIMSNKISSTEGAIEAIDRVIQNGEALECFIRMITSQGGDKNYVLDTKLFPLAPVIKKLYANESGYVSKINAEEIGKLALALGAGRETMDSIIDLRSGIVICKKVDDFVNKGDVLVEVHGNREDIVENVLSSILKTYSFDTKKGHKKKMILGEIK